MLVSRGDAIKSGNNEKKNKIEEEILKYCEENHEYISNPKEAYIYFETEEAYHRMMNYNEIKK